MDLTDHQMLRVLKLIQEKYGESATRYAQGEATRLEGLDQVKRDTWLPVLDALREVDNEQSARLGKEVDHFLQDVAKVI